MDALPVVLGVVFVAAAAVFALVPLLRSRGSTELLLPPTEEPAAERLRLYRAVLDLEFDYQTGKLDRADYESLTGELLAQAGDHLRSTRRDLDDVDVQVEREIAAARRAFASARASSTPAPLTSGSPEPNA